MPWSTSYFQGNRVCELALKGCSGDMTLGLWGTSVLQTFMTPLMCPNGTKLPCVLAAAHSYSCPPWYFTVEELPIYSKICHSSLIEGAPTWYYCVIIYLHGVQVVSAALALSLLLPQLTSPILPWDCILRSTMLPQQRKLGL